MREDFILGKVRARASLEEKKAIFFLACLFSISRFHLFKKKGRRSEEKESRLENPNFLHLLVYFDLGFEVWLRFGISFFYFVVVVLHFCFRSSIEEFGVKNELGFVWFGGAVHFFSSDPCSLSGHNLAIRPPN